MDFISIKNESKEFTHCFCNWWKGNNKETKNTDLVEIILRNRSEINMYGRVKHCNLILGKEYFPVATEGQLRQFIEHNIGGKLRIIELDGSNYNIVGNHRVFINTESEIMKAYLKVALEIAKEKVKV